MYNGYENKVSDETSRANSQVAVSTIESVAKSLDNPIYLQSRIDQIPNEVSEGN
jgi:hypothetical protein